MEIEYNLFSLENNYENNYFDFNSSDFLGLNTTGEKNSIQSDQNTTTFSLFNQQQYYQNELDHDGHHTYNENIDEEQGKNNEKPTLYQKREDRICLQQNINLGLIGFDRMKIFTGLTLMGDGTLRLCSVLGSVSFNFQQQIVDCVEDKKKLGVVDLHYSKNTSLKEHSLEEVLWYLRKINGINYKDIEFQLNRFYKLVDNIRTKMKAVELNNEELEQKDREFQEFIDFCYNYLDKHYNKNSQNALKIYWYSFGRINYKDKDTEIFRSGFSQSYLQLLGLSKSSLSTIFLRKQQVDLIKEKNSITQQTLQGMDSKFKMLEKDQSIIFITTFDGFPLSLIQKKILIQCPKKQFNKLIQKNDFFFQIAEMDVDLDELQRLIEYRQKILLKPENLSIDEFIQKELSYQFEDVEYSIHSQNFLEKFYEENLTKMRFIEQKLIKEQEEKVHCGYKLIDNNNQPPQIYYSASTISTNSA